MQIVIDIPEDTYNYIKANGARIPYHKLTDAIKNGAPLPKGHGRLIDEKEISLSGIHFETELDHARMIGRLNTASTIIESDKEGEDEKSDE